MANFCQHFLSVTAGEKDAFCAEMQRLADNERNSNLGQQAFGVTDEYLFDIHVSKDGEFVTFETRSNSPQPLIKIAQTAEIEFYLSSENFAEDVFAEYKFDGQTLIGRSLSFETLEEITELSDGSYRYNGEVYDSRGELCHNLLIKEDFKPIVL